MAFHINDAFRHILGRKRNDYIEMFVHHIVTVFLYAFSYLCNLTVAGSIIMYLHDIADIFTSGVQCFTETTLDRLSVFSAIGMTLSWFYTRILVFPFVIYYTGIQKYYFEQYSFDSNA